MNVELQWATYRDAADESGLSRIWGGIHPPCDDMPGRKIGETIGLAAVALAEAYFTDTDGDGLCDALEIPCLGDLNNDGYRNITDMLMFLSDFGCVGPDCVADINRDGFTNTADAIGYIFPNFGLDCE